MEKTNLENLNKLAKLFGTDRLISPEEVQEIRGVLVGVLANNKKELESLTAETRELVNKVLDKVLDEHDTYLEKTKQIAQEAKSDTTEAIQATMKSLEEVKKLCKEVMECKPENGKDADEEYVIGEVLNRIKLPEHKEVVLDDGAAIVDKINSLPVNEENQIDAKHIKNLPEVKGRVSGGGVSRKVVEQMIAAGGAAGIDLEVEGTPNVDQGKLNLLGGTNMTITDNGDGSVTFDATGGGSGSPGGSTTQLQYNNSGSFGGISGATTDGTAVTYTTGNLKGADIKASSSGGLQILSNNGTVASLHGAGGGANNTFYGDVKLDYATATTVPYLDASKNLISSAVTPTELGYVSGVTSSIQTQLNAKGAGTVTNVSSTNGALTVANGTTTPVLTVNSAPILTTARTIGTITGDATSAGSSFDGSANNTNALTLATVNSNVGTFGSATQASQVTVNAKGLVTAASSVTVTPAVGSITGLGTGVGTFLATPSSANLATAVTDETGSGSLVFGTSPTLTTPTINGATITGDFQTDGIPNTDDTWTGKSTNSFNAGGTIAQFDCVYLTSSSTWALTDADAIGTAGNVLIMMAGAAGTNGNALRVIEPGSWVRNDAWNWTVGGVLYLDTATPGGMTQTAPSGEDDAVKIVGHAVTSDVIYFAPSPNWIIYKA